MTRYSEKRKPLFKGIIILLIVFVASANFAVDRITKNSVQENVKGRGTIEVVGNFFILHYAENDGAFLGLGGGLPQPFKMILLVLMPIVLIGFSLFYIVSVPSLPSGQIVCLASIIGGGAGNLYDRIFNGGVVIDFLNFGIGNLRTGILNVADLSVTFGAVIFIILQYSRSEKPVNEN